MLGLTGSVYSLEEGQNKGLALAPVGCTRYPWQLFMQDQPKRRVGLSFDFPLLQGRPAIDGNADSAQDPEARQRGLSC